MVPPQPRLDVLKLKDERLAEDFANRLSGDLGGLGVSGNPEELWSAFKMSILDVASGCLETHHQVKKNLSPRGNWIPLTRVTGPGLLFRKLKHKTARLLRVDKEAYVRGVCECVEHYLSSSDDRGICALYSPSLSLGVSQLKWRLLSA